MRKYLMLLLLVPFLVGTGGCKGGTDAKQEAQTEQLVAEAHRQVGMPNITNFTERKFAKMILELRDEEMTTYSYFMDLNGKLHFLCNSIGYGLPYSVQYTNPERYELNGATLPQPDPNGLFMPQGLSATFVLCVGKDKQIHPVYSEPNLIISPFKLVAVDGYQR